jgi:hypothetical protein
MENNLNQKVLRRYSQEFARKVTESYFSDHDIVTNESVLEITPIKQVNLFVVKNLFDQWQQEIRRLRSPYFNYDAPKVTEVMEQLKNVLSRNITIGKEDYLLLLERSIEETLRLILSPYDYYKEFLGVDEELLTREYIRSTSKYIKINPFIMEALLQRIEKEQNLELTRQSARRLLDEVVDQLQGEPDDVEPHLESFSEVAPISMNELYSASRSNTWKEKKAKEAPASKRTLHDNLVKEDQATLLDIHQRQGIDDIRTHLTINQRFMFINSLFNGNETQFYETVDEIEKKENADEAMQYLEDHYGHWNPESEEVEEFYNIVQRRMR